MKKKIWIGFFVVLVLVGLVVRVDAIIVNEEGSDSWWLKTLDTAPAERTFQPSEKFDVLSPGYYFGVIIVGETKYQEWRDRERYEGYYGDGRYKILDEGVCLWWLNGKQFWNEWSGLYIIDGQPYSPLPSGDGLAVRMSKRDYYNWIDKNYYWALDRGVWLYVGRFHFIIPEPATLALLGLGGLALLRTRTRKRKQ